MYFCVNMDQYLDVYDEFCIYLELQWEDTVHSFTLLSCKFMLKGAPVV